MFLILASWYSHFIFYFVYSLIISLKLFTPGDRYPVFCGIAKEADPWTVPEKKDPVPYYQEKVPITPVTLTGVILPDSRGKWIPGPGKTPSCSGQVDGRGDPAPGA
jgi:hypothetical protein